MRVGPNVKYLCFSGVLQEIEQIFGIFLVRVVILCQHLNKVIISFCTYFLLDSVIFGYSNISLPESCRTGRFLPNGVLRMH